MKVYNNSMKGSIQLSMVQRLLYLNSMIGIAQTLSLSQEREYVFPQYTEIAPCPCDLSPGCDTYCCCDPKCPSDPPFPCLSGLPGGQPGNKLQDYNCSEPAPAAAGSSTLQLNNYLHPLLCIQSSNSPYRGHCHKPAAKLESHVKHEEVRKRKRRVRVSTYEEKGYGATSLGDSGNATLPYRRGLTVKTVYSVEEDITGVLSLPEPSLTSSHCSSQPIRFLKPTSHRCSTELSKQVCQEGKNSWLDHQMFLMDFPGIEKESNFPQVRSHNNQLNVSATEVNYFYTTAPEFYLRGLGGEQPVDEEQEEDDIESLTRGLDQKEAIEKQKFELNPNSVSSFSPASYASFHPETNQCRNIVMEARYLFTWNGTSLLSVKVDILLANLSLPSENSSDALSQYFKVAFQHEKPVEEKAENVKDGTDGQKYVLQERSGSPYYKIGFPLITGRLDEDKVKPAVMRVWSSGSSSSLCQNEIGMGLMIGEDTISGCLVRVSKRQVKECREIYNSVSALQKKLLGGADVVVGRRGNVNFTNPTDFVRVIHENQTEQEGKTEMGLLLPSCKVASLLRLTVLHTSGRVARRGEQELLVVGVKATLAEETWTWRCTSTFCPETQTFLLRTEVEWVEVPEVWADKNTSRFWLRQAALSCEGDRCWRHLLHPLPGNLPPEQMAQVAELAILGLLIFPTALCYSWHSI